MQSKELQRSMYELHHPSTSQRLTLAVLAGAWVLLLGWLLLGGGLEAGAAWFGWTAHPGDPIRRACLVAGFAVYYIRILFTEFVFLKRGVGWNEVFTISPWLLVIILLLGITGGANPDPPGVAFAAGLLLFIVGSWMNSYAEFARHAWKQRPENRGRLYTGGLFRYSRHPNYFGDLVSFSGLCLFSGRWFTVVVPLLMLTGFVFVNIPVLDSHLRDHYGADFDDYACHTRKLIPFVY